MSGSKPDAALVQRAIDVYVKTAYPDGPPVAVRSMLATERSWAGHLTDAPVFIKDDPKNTTKYSMRLGNASYPHMKLVIERTDEKQGFLFAPMRMTLTAARPPGRRSTMRSGNS